MLHDILALPADQQRTALIARRDALLVELARLEPLLPHALAAVRRRALVSEVRGIERFLGLPHSVGTSRERRGG